MEAEASLIAFVRLLGRVSSGMSSFVHVFELHLHDMARAGQGVTDEGANEADCPKTTASASSLSSGESLSAHSVVQPEEEVEPNYTSTPPDSGHARCTCPRMRCP